MKFCCSLGYVLKSRRSPQNGEIHSFRYVLSVISKLRSFVGSFATTQNPYIQKLLHKFLSKLGH